VSSSSISKPYRTGRRFGFPGRLLPLLFLLVLAAVGCGGGEKGEVRGQTERFVEALYDGNRAAVRKLAPDLAETGAEAIPRLFETIQSYPQWSVEEISVRDSEAEAKVRFSAEEKSLTLRLPLRKTGEGWRVGTDIRFSSSLDFVPLE
jgi:hypothetical protein